MSMCRKKKLPGTRVGRKMEDMCFTLENFSPQKSQVA